MSDTTPAFSVVTVSYWTGPTLRQQVASVLAQPELREFVVVDNGNPEVDRHWLAERSARDPRLRLLTGHGNCGFAAGCNMGARQATAPLLIFLNPDCLLPEGALARLAATVHDLPHPWLLGLRLQYPDGREQRGSRRRIVTPWNTLAEVIGLHRLRPGAGPGVHLHEQPLPNGVSDVPAITGACMVVPQDAYWAVQGLNERHFYGAEDLDFCLRFRRAGGRIFFEPNLSVTHHRTTSVANPVAVESYKTHSFLLYFWDNFRRPRDWLPLALVSALIVARWPIKVLRKSPDLLRLKRRRAALARTEGERPSA